MTNENDNGAWWVEDGVLHLDMPRLLRNLGLEDTEENRGLAVKVVLEVAQKELPRKPVMVVEQRR